MGWGGGVDEGRGLLERQLGGGVGGDYKVEYKYDFRSTEAQKHT